MCVQRYGFARITVPEVFARLYVIDLFLKSLSEELWGRIYESSRSLFLDEIGDEAVGKILDSLEIKLNQKGEVLGEKDREKIMDFLNREAEREGGKSWLTKKVCRFVIENGIEVLREIKDEELFIRIFRMDIEELKEDEIKMLRNLARLSIHAPVDIKKIAKIERDKNLEQDIKRDREIRDTTARGRSFINHRDNTDL